MKVKTKKRIATIVVLMLAMIALVEFQKYLKQQTPACDDGVCKLPDDYNLIINPFPPEIVPVEAATNQPDAVQTTD